MLLDIRTAGIASHAEARIRLLAQLMTAFGYKARLSSWDGSRCDVLIADIDSSGGAQACEKASARHSKVMALSQSGDLGPDSAYKAQSGAPAAVLAKALAAMLEQSAKNEINAALDCALIQLATVPTLSSGILLADFNNCSIIINRNTSRIYARSQNELKSAQRLFCQSDVDFSILRNTADIRDQFMVSMALDAFCIVSALAYPIELPDLPDMHLQLIDWPDIGPAADIPNIFNLIRFFKKGAARSDAAIANSGVNLHDAKAMLWALKASGALTEATVITTPSSPIKEKSRPAIEAGFFGKLMQKFGFPANNSAAASAS